MMQAVRQMWEASGYHVQGTAISSVASKGLEAGTHIPSHTLAYYKKLIHHNKLKLTEKDILVVDEAGMVPSTDLSELVSATQKAGAKIVLIGDPEQLQPIAPGAPFRALSERIGSAEMSDVRRQRDKGDREATRLLSQGKIDEALQYYEAKGAIEYCANPDMTQARLIENWAVDLFPSNIADRLILATKRDDVATLNHLAQEKLRAIHLITEKPRRYHTHERVIELSRDDRILFLKNDKILGVTNGDFGRVKHTGGDSLTVEVRGKEVTFNPTQYTHFDLGYAATIHKAQGATYDDVHVYAGSHFWDRYLTYVALSRHRDKLHIHVDRGIYSHSAALSKRLGRHTLKDNVLDFPLSYAMRRGFEPESLAGRCIEKIARVKATIKESWQFIFNYQAYLLQHAFNVAIESRAHTREEASLVAEFVDQHRALGRKWSEFKAQEHDKKTFYASPDYQDYIKQSVLKNNTAAEIYQDMDKFKPAMQANQISLDAIEKVARSHAFFEQTKAFIQAYQKKDLNQALRLSQSLYPQIRQQFGYFQHAATCGGFKSTSELTHLIKVHYQDNLFATHQHEDPLRYQLVHDYLVAERNMRAAWKVRVPT